MFAAIISRLYKIFSLLLTVIGLTTTTSAHAQLAEPSNSGKVLVVLSAANSIPLVEGGIHPTGLFLGELAEPAEAMLLAGYQLVFASPKGMAPTIDSDSLRSIYWGYSKKRLDHAKEVYSKLVESGLNSPIPLEDLAGDVSNLDQFDAIFVPGGHGPLVDLYFKNMFEGSELNNDMGKILEFFHNNSRPTGLLCHAPAALAAAPFVDGKWIYSGYKITAISRASEWFNEDFIFTRVIQGHVGVYPSDVLKAAGANYVYTKVPMAPFVAEDRELMTGQDPFAAKLMGIRFVQNLNRYMASKKAK